MPVTTGFCDLVVARRATRFGLTRLAEITLVSRGLSLALGAWSEDRNWRSAFSGSCGGQVSPCGTDRRIVVTGA